LVLDLVKHAVLIFLSAKELLKATDPTIELQRLICESLDDDIFVTLLLEELIKFLVKVVPLPTDPFELLLHFLVEFSI
jgi:hypothetical protein